jgi:DNA/RNA endonuclease YhcR with UshA esterase domain
MLWKSVVLVLSIGAAAAAEDLPVIAPAEARANVNKVVVVEYTVLSAGFLDDKLICFLNSERENRDDKNFTAFVTPKGMRAFSNERKIENPAASFIDKKIRVTGKVELHKSKPEIRVERPDQIVVVKTEVEDS